MSALANQPGCQEEHPKSLPYMTVYYLLRKLKFNKLIISK